MTESYVDRFEAQVRRTPDRIAVKMGETACSYAQLNRSANRTAHCLLDELGEASEAVAALFEYTPAGVAALLGVLKAGKFGVLPPPGFPRSRIEYMVADSGARLLLCDHDTVALAEELELPGAKRLNIGEINRQAPDHDPAAPITPDTALILRYTSGSTGLPKGVVHTHRNILHSIDNQARLGECDPEGRHLLLGTVTTGLAVRTLLAPLVHGAMVFPFDIRKQGLAGFKDLLAREKISVIQIGPALFRTLAHSIAPSESLPALRQVSLIGDTVYPRDICLFQEAFSPPCTLRISFGTSETSGAAAIVFDHDSQIPRGRVPAGYAVAGKQLLIVDDNHEPVDAGRVGEIAVRSRYLSSGYWGRPELTRRRFLPDPEGGDRRIYLTGDLGRLQPDGCLEHLGRKDYQIKIRGLRIEAAEVETALLDLGVFKEVVVVAHRRQDNDGDGESILVAHVVAARLPAPSPDSLRQRLATTLPEHMIPASFVFSDALPRTPNGKVQRDQLPPPGRRRPDLDVPFTAPTSATEQTIAAIWRQLLQLDEVGVDDRFLELGGDSLLAMRILTRIEQRLQVKIPPQTLFEAATIAELARAVDAIDTGTAGSADSTRQH